MTKTKSVVAKNTLGPAKKAVVYNRLTNPEDRVREIDGPPVGRIGATAFLENKNKLAIILSTGTSAGETFVHLLKKEAKNRVARENSSSGKKTKEK